MVPDESTVTVTVSTPFPVTALEVDPGNPGAYPRGPGWSISPVWIYTWGSGPERV